MSESIQKVITHFFHSLEINYETLQVTQKENILTVKINTNESGILIGSNGKNFDYIHGLLRQMINKGGEVKYKLHIEINDYQNSKDERLFQFVQSKINHVKKTGSEYILPYYSAYDRKKIHSYVSRIPDKNFYIKSIGEGSKRKIHIIKEQKKLSIDIDGNDI